MQNTEFSKQRASAQVELVSRCCLELLEPSYQHVNFIDGLLDVPVLGLVSIQDPRSGLEGILGSFQSLECGVKAEQLLEDIVRVDVLQCELDVKIKGGS